MREEQTSGRLLAGSSGGNALEPGRPRPTGATFALLGLVAALAACRGDGDASGKVATGRPGATAAGGGDGSTQLTARELPMGTTVTGKLPCEPGKQSLWWRLVPAPSAGHAKLELRTPRQGDQSCVHLNAYDAAGVLLDTTAAPCSDQVAEFASGDGPLKAATTFLELRSTMGTCLPSDYRLSVSK